MPLAGNGYLLLLGVEQRFRERAVVAALRCYMGAVGCLTRNSVLGRNRLFDVHLAGDPRDAKSAVAAVLAHADKTGERPVAVVPLNDGNLESAVAVADCFGLPSQPPDVTRDCRNKDAMKRHLGAAGLPVARHIAFTTKDELLRRAHELTFPVVVKPAEFGGSGGVSKVDDASALSGAFHYARAVLDEYAKSYHIDPCAFLVEEYVPATAEVSVEVLAGEESAVVIAVTDKFLGPEPWFAEMGHAVPSAHTERPDIGELAKAACRVLNVSRGMCHVEIRIRPDGRLILMEVAARPGGDRIMDLVERVYGLSPYVAHIRSWMGLPFQPFPSVATGTAAIAFLKAPPGIVRAVREPADIPEAVIGLELTATVGARSSPPIDWRSRDGVVELFSPARPWPDDRDHPMAMAARLADQCIDVDGEDTP